MPGKAHKPDKQSSELVSALALNGVAQDRIAMHVGVSPVTLRKFYRDTLDLATESVCARVAKNLVRIASSGSGNAAVQAAKYVLGAKGGWKDVGRLEVEHEFEASDNAHEIIAGKLAEMAGVRERIFGRINSINVPDWAGSSEVDKGPQEGEGKTSWAYNPKPTTAIKVFTLYGIGSRDVIAAATRRQKKLGF